jgi:hypothetical protein
MNKDLIVSIIRNAKASHKRWVENALSLIEGLPLDKNQVPVNATDCEFGTWYYAEGQALRGIPAYREIEEHHDVLHQTYREIFVLLFAEATHTSLFSKLFGSSQKTSAENHKKAKDKFKLLELHSRNIMGKLDELERMLVGMSQEQIDSYINKKGGM